MRIRRAGWHDVELQEPRPQADGQWLTIEMQRIEDPAQMVQQLPGNCWMDLVLDEFENRDHLLEFKMQCTYCHQQGSPLTSRRQFDRAQWEETIVDMARRSAIISHGLRDVLPDRYLAAYDEANVLARLPG